MLLFCLQLYKQGATVMAEFLVELCGSLLEVVLDGTGSWTVRTLRNRRNRLKARKTQSSIRYLTRRHNDTR